MGLTVPKGVLGGLLAFAVVHGPVSAADTPKKAADIPAVDADSVTEWERAFVRDSAITVHLRSYYLDRKTPSPPGPAAWAAGGALGYQSGWLGNMLRVGMTGFTSQPVWAPADRDGTLLLKPGQEGYSVLGQAYVSLKLWDHVFTGYRQRVDEPEVNPYDIRMTPQTFEGYTLAGKVRHVSYTVAYLDRMKPINSDRFLNMAAVAGAPPGVSEPLWLGEPALRSGKGLHRAPFKLSRSKHSHLDLYRLRLGYALGRCREVTDRRAIHVSEQHRR